LQRRRRRRLSLVEQTDGTRTGSVHYTQPGDHTHTHTHTRLSALFRDCPGQPVRVKPIWILLKQEWQWHQLGHMQDCTSLQTDNHASHPTIQFFTGRMSFLPPNQQRQCAEGTAWRSESLYSATYKKTRMVRKDRCQYVEL